MIPNKEISAPLEEKFIKQWEIKEYCLIKKFKSKKNQVYLIKAEMESGLTESFVLKEYADGTKDMEKEASILHKLQEKKIHAPILYYMGKKHIVMEYIQGQLFLDFFEEMEMAGPLEKEAWHTACATASSLAYWFKNFYKVMENHYGKTMIMYDINLRNFIIRDEIYGFDFEDCRLGKKETDTGRLCAYLLTYEPAFTDWKKELVREFFIIFTKNLDLDPSLVKEEMFKELESISQRRKLVYPMEFKT
ncbi:BUD32 family EKC/KEOPS complex subunit [Candidatus Contubernalis alkaliaceticus]|uniref:hypothetical protein n=1 Tax=Candidatus Contubernalis alkaliaceticus TaxID=338645 RepID=UPI001F4C2E09|nr:hypothetical protein [Candidatus Contubernalis alkalaceticus]UNC91951.1 hypothetical protein HUE98_07475 [Candidatus Contubernalis alkalaceticus]